MSPFFSFNKLVGGLHLAYFQYVQHPNATPLTAQNIKKKKKTSIRAKKCLGRESTSSLVVHNSIYFTWTETIYSLRLYKHKIEHNTLGLSRTPVPPLHIFSFVHFCPRTPVCLSAKFVFQGRKNPRPRQAHAIGRSIRLIIQIA